MNKAELRLISELLKNSRRSNEELARAMGTSQSIVSKMIRKLENEGVIREYTVIPDFLKLGFQIMSFVYVRMSEDLKKELDEQSITSTTFEGGVPSQFLVGNGMGLDCDALLITLHRSFSEYADFLRILRGRLGNDSTELKSFLADLEGQDNFLGPALLGLAKYLCEVSTSKD